MNLKTVKDVKDLIKKEGNIDVFTYKGFTCMIRRNLIIEGGQDVNKYSLFNL